MERIEGNALEEQNWSSRLAWSNLYKIAPVIEGKRSAPILNAQFEHCIENLRMEIELLMPEKVHFMTFQGWFSWFAEPLSVEIRPHHANSVDGMGDLNLGPCSARFLVSTGPEGKNETEWLEEVVSAFGA